MKTRFLLLTGLLACLSIQVMAQSANVTLIPSGAVWSYRDNGSDQGTAWRAPSFNDSTWAAGQAQFGYGDGDEALEERGGIHGSGK